MFESLRGNALFIFILKGVYDIHDGATVILIYDITLRQLPGY